MEGMIHINFDPDQLPPHLKAEWDALQKDVQDATNALIQKWETTHKLTQNDLADTVWRKINSWLKDHGFHGKCAYCETHLESARQSGDAEHYRPKLKVNYKAADKKSYVTPQAEHELGQLVNHPGYFWFTTWKVSNQADRTCAYQAGINTSSTSSQDLPSAKYRLHSSSRERNASR
jgi:hypothetical protein